MYEMNIACRLRGRETRPGGSSHLAPGIGAAIVASALGVLGGARRTSCPGYDPRRQ
jgi:hypothetical protein